MLEISLNNIFGFKQYVEQVIIIVVSWSICSKNEIPLIHSFVRLDLDLIRQHLHVVYSFIYSYWWTSSNKSIVDWLTKYLQINDRVTNLSIFILCTVLFDYSITIGGDELIVLFHDSLSIKQNENHHYY